MEEECSKFSRITLFRPDLVVAIYPGTFLYTVALVRMPVALTYAIYTLTLSSQATSRNPTTLHHIDIDHVGTQGSSASCAMRPNKAETAVYGCWLLSSIFIFICFWVATMVYSF